ncbi:hypothetical protein ILUMI_10504, partial [Ignelater luminosus]
MGGNSRSHKRRSRASRKKTKNSNVVSTDAPTCEAMVEVPTPLNSDVTERGNGVENSCEGSVANSDNATENAEVQSILENKVLERMQTNYRVESPETVSKKANINKKQNGGTVVKSKSLDDDDLVKITELSEASEGEDKNLAEYSAVVSEADSDVEWETTEEFKSEKRSEERGECLSTSTLPLEELETVHVTLISPEDEHNLRTFLKGLNLVTSPEEAVDQTEKKESYKERKARKRAAIAEHFMPVLQFPRFLDVIREESNDNNSDKEPVPGPSTTNLHPYVKSQEFIRSKEPNIQKRMESHFPKSESEKVIIVGGKLTETANVQGTWSTSIAETSSSAAEVVYLEDSSTSKTPSDSSDIEENMDADGEDEDSKSEDISHNSSLHELNTETPQKPTQTNNALETSTSEISDDKILPPPSQLTPPPTPDLATPKNETICERQQCDAEIEDFIKTVMSYLSKRDYSAIRAVTKDIRFKDLPEETRNQVNEVLTEISDVSFSQEDAFNKEFKGFCEELNLQNPCKYVNAVSPPAPSRSPSVSSEGSSKTNSQCTARYNPMCSSIGDVADLLKEEENAKDILKLFQPETLRELCLKELMSLPFGADVLEELAEVSQSIQELTGTWQTKISPSLQRLRKHFPTPSVPAFMSKKSTTNDTNDSFKLPAKIEEMPFISTTKWVGIPTQQDPKVLVCLSPTQKSYLETTKKVPDEAGKLLELHQKFMDRRGYHEEIRAEPDYFKKVDITGSSGNKKNQDASEPREFSNRLLAIIRETKDAQPNINDSMQRTLSDDHYSYTSRVEEVKTLPRKYKMNVYEDKAITGNSAARDLNEWLNLAREKSTSAPNLEETHEFSNTVAAAATGTYQSTAVNEGTRVQSSGGNTTRSTNIPNRRFSLPQEVYQRQIQYIREKEKELQEEIEKLEKEKRKVIFEMAAEVPVRQFEAGKYHISKKGDIAIHNDEEKSQKTETDKQRVTLMAPTEFFRQKMYDEYMKKVAAREDRKMHKVIKITSSKTSQVEESTESSKCEITHVSGIEDEFMDRVKERMQKYGLERDDSEENRKIDSFRKTEDSQDPVLVMDGDLLKDAKELPKHLQEFVDITRQAADNSEDDTSD